MRKIILIILFTTVCLSLNAQDYKIYTYNKNDTINLNDILYFKKDTIDVIYLVFIDDRLLTICGLAKAAKWVLNFRTNFNGSFCQTAVMCWAVYQH